MENTGQMISDFLNEHIPDVCSAPLYYHYTTMGVLDAFLKDGADLYGTHFAVLNDSSEVDNGWKIVSDFLTTRFGFGVMQRTAIDSLHSMLQANGKLPIPWIMSFSTLPDSLNQWVGYTDRKTGGYAVGFDASALRERATEASDIARKIWLLPCLYSGRELDDSLILELLDRLFPINDANMASFAKATAPDPKSMAVIAMRSFLLVSLVKHHSFEYEHEVRLVIEPISAKLKSSCELLGGKPRMKAGIGNQTAAIRDLIKEVWVSPHGDKRLLATVVKTLTQNAGIDRQCKIKLSNLPYNGR